MKFFICALTTLLATPAFAAIEKQNEFHALPAVEITKAALGGTVLVIHMQHSLVIDGNVQAGVTKELGDDSRKELFHAMVMEQDAEVLREKFAKADRPSTQSILERYSEIQDLILHSQDPNLKLN